MLLKSLQMAEYLQTTDIDLKDDDIDEEERRGAGYIDEQKKSSYVPDSVHGSQHHNRTWTTDN